MVNSTTRITDLHQDVLFEILCYLPAKYIITCSCVCKDWANLIYQPFFPQLYSLRGKAPVQLLLERDSRMVLVQLDESLYTATNPFNFSVPADSIFDLKIQRRSSQRKTLLHFSSCHYTCWIVTLDLNPYFMNNHDQGYTTCPQYHIYNPITGQHIFVRKPIRCDLELKNCALILAQKTNRLKLLEFYDVKPGRTKAYIHTIGSKIWRRIDKVPFQNHELLETPVWLNGHCHWLDSRLIIHSLDAEEEVFRVIGSPNKCLVSCLGLLNGCLCVVSSDFISNEVWVMNKYGIQDSWTKVFDIYNVQYFGPLKSLKTGEFLMLGELTAFQPLEYATSTMLCYNPHSRHCRYITNDTPDGRWHREYLC